MNANISGLDNATMYKYFDLISSNAVKWSEKGWGGYIKSTEKGQQFELVNPGSSLPDAMKDMQPLLEFLAANNQTEYDLTTEDSWFNYFQHHLKPPSKHVGSWSGAVGSRLFPREAFQNDGNRKSLTETMLKLFNQNINMWLMFVTPTKFPHTKTSALHPSWESAIWSIRINAKWDQFTDRSKYETHFKSAHNASESLRVLAPDMAVSIQEADVWDEKFESSYWGEANYDRLLEIKKAVDPENVLTNYHAVWWNKDDSRYRCYPKP